MSTTLLNEILGVRAQLGYPLQGNPSPRQIVEELSAEYQQVTNQSNNDGQSWQVSNHVLTTVAGQRVYELTGFTDPGDFYKALIVTTVPENENADPQYPLEFVEMEHLPQEWGWLGQMNGQLMYSSHDSQLIAFYRKIEAGGVKLYAELRPTPTEAQSYNILYQQTDWWDEAMTSLNAVMPHSSQRFYIRACVARNLLGAELVKWSFDEKKNSRRAKNVLSILENKIDRYLPQFQLYIASLDNPDVTYQTSWCEGLFID